MAKPDRKPDPDFEPDYDAPDAEYDDVAQDDYEQTAGPDYDEAAQPDSYHDFSDAYGDCGGGSQEWRHRPQK